MERTSAVIASEREGVREHVLTLSEGLNWFLSEVHAYEEEIADAERRKADMRQQIRSVRLLIKRAEHKENCLQREEWAAIRRESGR